MTSDSGGTWLSGPPVLPILGHSPSQATCSCQFHSQYAGARLHGPICLVDQVKSPASLRASEVCFPRKSVFAFVTRMSLIQPCG
jgi:hypothetical protein